MSGTLYERLGGEDAITAVVDEFYDRVMADEQVAGYFDDVDMETVHADMGITPSDFQAIATHLDDALAEFDVGKNDRQAVREEIASYQDAIVTAAD